MIGFKLGYIVPTSYSHKARWQFFSLFSCLSLSPSLSLLFPPLGFSTNLPSCHIEAGIAPPPTTQELILDHFNITRAKSGNQVTLRTGCLPPQCWKTENSLTLDTHRTYYTCSPAHRQREEGAKEKKNPLNA